MVCIENSYGEQKSVDQVVILLTVKSLNIHTVFSDYFRISVMNVIDTDIDLQCRRRLTATEGPSQLTYQAPAFKPVAAGSVFVYV
jgi:hypothetical protein